MTNINVLQLAKILKYRSADVVKHIEEEFQSVERLCRLLDSSVDSGLPDDSVIIERHRDLFGENVIPSKPPKKFIKLLLEAFNDTILLILLGAAVISFGVSFVPSDDADHKMQWIESLAIVAAVFLVVLVTAVNDYQKEKQFQGLYGQISQDNNFSVTRGGKITSINVEQIVVGDICSLKYGDLIPADGVIILSSDLKIDESSLTGESDIVKKSKTHNPLVFSGTHVMEGSGTMLVLAVGVNSQSGIIASLLGVVKKKSKIKKAVEIENLEEGETLELIHNCQNENMGEIKGSQQSVLQSKLSKLTLKIGVFGIIMAVLTTVTLLIRFCVKTYVVEKKPWDSGSHLHLLIGHFITGVTVLVVALPEGLPLAVTLSLAYSVKKMIYDNNLVRHLDACETMGSATTICSDKTGTLTTNRMTVVELFVAGKYFKFVPKVEVIPSAIVEVLKPSIAINSSYTSILVDDVSGRPKQMGNKTECALLGLLTRLNVNYKQIRSDNPQQSFYKLYTFNSIRKSMSTVIRTENSFRVYCKGATELILCKCSSMFNAKGEVQSLRKPDIEYIFENVISTMAKSGLRTLCLAYRDFPLDEEPDWEDEDSVIRDLTCVTITGIEDPIRDEVPEAIRKVKRAGIVVRMITGDNINTAQSIALKCGIISPNDNSLVMDSEKFNLLIRTRDNKVDQKLLDKIWPKLMVLARSSPADKYTLINGIINSKLYKNRQVVAVTGDGTNDAPALKKADVGFSMGMAGTDVAKKASDIIITDDNFSSIVKAVMWGRNVYDNISKFLKFQLTVNMVAVIVAFVGSAIFRSSPLSAIQMLWVNLIMDTFASLALATEKPTEALLNRRPYGRTKALISRNMMKSILGHSFYQITVIFIVLYLEPFFRFSESPDGDFTIIFNVFVLMTLMNEINCRKIHGERNVFENILKNPMFLVIWVSTFIVHVVIVEFGSYVFKTRHLTFVDWIICCVFGVGSLLWEQVLIFIPTERLPKSIALGRMQNEEIQIITEERMSVLSKSHGQILWIRSAQRIRSQLRVIRAFNECLTQDKNDPKQSPQPSVTVL